MFHSEALNNWSLRNFANYSQSNGDIDLFVINSAVLVQNIQFIALKILSWSIFSQCGLSIMLMSLIGSCGQSVSASALQTGASVVITLHFSPAGDPILLVWLFRLKSQIELIAVGLAYFHPLVLWHYPVVDGPLEEAEPDGPGWCVPPTMGGVSSPQSVSLSLRAGSSSQPSALWPRTSLSDWLAGRSRTSIV